MKSTINKTFDTCSTESLFLKSKKIYKKAFKLGSFLRCSVNTFPVNDGCAWLTQGYTYLRLPIVNHVF